MPELDLKLEQWRHELEATLAFAPDEIAELEDHLQLVYEQKRKEGHDGESAWNHALSSLGSPNSLALEFTKNKLFPAFCRLLGSWSRALVLLGLFIGLDVCATYLSFDPLDPWDPPVWAGLGISVLVTMTFAFILLPLTIGQRNAVIAGVGNAFALIPLLYTITYNSYAESIIGHGWSRQGVSFELWQICLGLGALAITNLWWRKGTISRQSMALMVSVVSLITVAPFLNDFLCNLSLRVFYDLPDHVPQGVNSIAFCNWGFLHILIGSVVFVASITPLALSGIGSLGTLWTIFSVRKEISEVSTFPSRESVPWLLVMVASGFSWVIGCTTVPPFVRNLTESTGHPITLFLGIDAILFISAFTFLVCQRELTRQVHTSKSIYPFFSWLLVVVEFAFVGAISYLAISVGGSEEEISLILTGFVVVLMAWQMKIIRQKTDHGISIWRIAGSNLAQNGLLAGVILAIVILPLMMTAFNCAFVSNIAISSAIAWGKSLDPAHHAGYNPETYMNISHLPSWFMGAIYISWCIPIGLAFVIIISGLEFIRFNAWRLYKGRLIAKLVEMEKRSAKPQTATNLFN